MSEEDRRAKQLTCVGTVVIKAEKTMRTKSKFDLCSSDCRVLASFTKNLGAKVIDRCEGAVKMISGTKRVSLPKYEINIQDD